MRKKILLSTLLASSAFVSANSFALEPRISYNVEDKKFIVNDERFDKYSNAKQHLQYGIMNSKFSRFEVASALKKVSNESWIGLIDHSHKNHDYAENFVKLYNDFNPQSPISLSEFKKISDSISILEEISGYTLKEDMQIDLAQDDYDIAKYLKELEDHIPDIMAAADEVRAGQQILEMVGYSKEESKDIFKEAFKEELKLYDEFSTTAEDDIFNYFSQNTDNSEDLTDEKKTIIREVKEKSKNTLLDKEIEKALSSDDASKKELTEQRVLELIKQQIDTYDKTKEGKYASKEATKARKESINNRMDTLREEAKNAKDAKKLLSAIKPDESDKIVSNAAETSISVVDARMNTLSRAAAPSAGDMLDNYGMWIKGSMSRGDQKSFGLESGYKFDQTGFTVGADVGDDFLVGAAYSFYKNNTKSQKAGDSKDNSITHIATIYGAMEFGSIYVNGQVQGGFSNIKKSRNSGDLDKHVAKGKTKAQTYGGKVEVGYNYTIPSTEAIITPSLAIAHNDVKVKGFKETGLGLNRKIDARNSSRTDGIAGLSAKYRINTNDMVIFPEIHAYVNHAVNAKNSSTKIYLIDGMDPIVTPSQKLTKTSYKFGGSLNVYTEDAIEASLGYDYGMAKKFQSHTGTAKVRINF